MPQLLLLLSILLAIEFVCLLIYACGGHGLKLLLQQGGIVRAVNLLAGSVILFVAGSLMFFE